VKRADVGSIHLAEGQLLLSLNIAAPTDRVPTVWARGYDGTGADIAILETDNVDFDTDTNGGPECTVGTYNCFLHPGATQQGVLGLTYYHATLVASVAASNHSTYRGIAPGATIMSAGMLGGERQDAIDALVWAFNNGAEVVNLSGGFCPGSTQMDIIDKAFDYYARTRNRLIVVAAGNNGTQCTYSYIDSPAKGWNVLSVGAFDDKNNAAWSNDVMADFSAYVNPASPSSDREKPEVVAPGVDIVGIGLFGTLVDDPDLNTGTSFAAPQVAGLAALLIDRHSSLSIWPEASRAIIMASAVHNVDGPSNIPTGTDWKDGAGGIDAALADVTATTRCVSSTSSAVPCWWGESINNTNFPVGTYLYRNFKASRGERIRTAISWWSLADCVSESNCNYDRLDTNLHLGVFAPDNSLVPGAWSASWDNNYELVEFIAPQTGQYKIGVFKSSASETSNYIGIAWVKDATYLPDIRSDYNGWDSEITIRNHGAEPVIPTITFFNTDGSFALGVTPSSSLQPNAVWRYNPALTNFTGSAIVSGGEDVLVLVQTRQNNDINMHTGLTVVGGSGAGWEQIGTTLYAPVVKKSHFGRSTRLVIVNAGASNTTATIQFYPSGSYTTPSIAPNGKVEVLSTNCGATLCSAKITASQPLAIMVLEQADAGTPISSNSNAFSAGANTNYVPVVKKNWAGGTTGLVVQNLGSANTTVALTAYGTDGDATTYNCGSLNVAPSAAGVFYFGNITCQPALPASFLGSAKLTTNPSQPIATVVQESTASSVLAANAPMYGAPAAYALGLYGNYSQDGQAWDSGISVQNTGNANATVTLTYYDASGNVMSTWTQTVTINPNRAQIFSRWRGNLPNPNFSGSVVITSTQPVVATVNTTFTGGGDAAASYTAPNR